MEKVRLTPQEGRVAHPQKPAIVATLRKPNNVQRRIAQGAIAAIQRARTVAGLEMPQNVIEQLVQMAEPILRFTLTEFEGPEGKVAVTPDNFPEVVDELFAPELMVRDVKMKGGDGSEISATLAFGEWLATVGLATAFPPADIDPKESTPQ